MSSLVWLAVFLSLHACNARNHLVDRDKIGKELYNPSKDNIKGPCMEDQLFKLGKKTKSSSSLEIPEVTISLKEQCNTTMRRKLGLEVEEGKESAKFMEEKEDIVVMDYVQPHRKPPIHNEETLN